MNFEILGLILISAKQMAMQVFTDINSQIHDGKARRALMMRLDNAVDDDNFRLIATKDDFGQLKEEFNKEVKGLLQRLQLANEILAATTDLFAIGAGEMGGEQKKALEGEIVPRFLKVLQIYLQYYPADVWRIPFLEGGVLSRFLRHILIMPDVVRQ